MNGRATKYNLPPALRRAVPPARAAALDALAAVFNGADLQAALAASLPKAPAASLSPQDKALATELAYGALRGRTRALWLAGQFMRKGKQPPALKLILLMTIHELISLERIPARATVNWAVEGVKRAFGPGLAGMVNAVLRRIAELGELGRELDDSWFAARLNGAELLSIRHSVPQWIVELWTDEYGPERCLAALRALSAPPAPAVRVNAARPGWQELRERLIAEHGGQPVGACGVLFHRRLPEAVRELEHGGLLSLQSGASQEILRLLEPRSWPGPVWDACAGRGGKSLALLEQGVRVALASDPAAKRLDGLALDAARLGLNPPPALAATAQEIAGRQDEIHSSTDEDAYLSEPNLPGANLPGANLPEARLLEARKHLADVHTILIDAPCSGLGTLARRPDIMLRRGPDDVRQLAATQTDILTACAARLKPGDKLAYITCTLSRRENEAQVDMLQERLGFTLERLAETSLEADTAGEANPTSGGYFFGALLTKR